MTSAADLIHELIARAQQLPDVEDRDRLEEVRREITRVRELVIQAARYRLRFLHYDEETVNSMGSVELRGVILSDFVSRNIRKYMKHFIEEMKVFIGEY